MPKTSHAAARAPQQAQEPTATLSQLRELLAQYEKNSVPRDYMQDFLRRRLVRPGPIVTVQPPPAPNPILTFIEGIAREHYPHTVNEILEIVAPFCDPELDLEFQPYSNTERLENEVKEALFWLQVNEVHPVLLANYRCHAEKVPGVGELKGKKFQNCIHEDMFADVLKTYDLLNTVSREGAHSILYGALEGSSVYNHLNQRLGEAGAFRYQLLGNIYQWEGSAIVGSVTAALERAILFTVTGDQQRLQQTLKFLTFQRSGRPVYHWHDGVAYILALHKQ